MSHTDAILRIESLMRTIARHDRVGFIAFYVLKEVPLKSNRVCLEVL